MIKLVSPPKFNVVTSSFGEIYTYKVFAVKTSQSFFRFIDTLGEHLNESFSYMTTHAIKSDEHEGFFKVAMANLSSDEEVCCYAMENKTFEYEGCSFLKSNKEKNCSFQTLSFFEEMLYFINKQGLAQYRDRIVDCDYLVFSVIKIDSCIQIADFEENLFKINSFIVEDYSDVLERKPDKKTKPGIADVIKRLLSEFEHSKREFVRKKKIEKLSRYEIPRENLEGFFEPSYVEMNLSIIDNIPLFSSDDEDL